MTEDTNGKKRVLIIGGVAGGASCAARARRLSETAEIIVFERGSYVSFANCGLPYYVGDVITEEDDLIISTPEFFKDRFNIEVRTRCEVLSIDREKREIEVKDLASATRYREKYDALVLAPGAAPIRPPLPGIDLPGIFSLRTIPDSRQIREWIAQTNTTKAVIVGGGFIGLEVVENLTRRGISVTVIEMQNHVLPPIDYEMARPLHDRLTGNGVELVLEEAVAGFSKTESGGLEVKTSSGRSFPADMVILAIGVRPENGLAKESGLEIGERGHIRVNERMRTSDEHIWAVGDAVETTDFVTGERTGVPLAGPANRQGRIAADVIFGRDRVFRGVQATAVCGVMGLTVASTGLTENTLKRLAQSGKQVAYDKVYLYPDNHVGYYPGATELALKLIFSTKDGKVLGAQAVGENGADKRIDVISMAIQNGATVYDLEEAELCYAPQYGAAKDPINLAGMIAANALRGDAPLAHWEDAKDSGAVILDVRDPEEYDESHIENALFITLHELRDRLDEVPRDKEIWVHCRSGQRSYYATRILRQNSFDARNLTGGIITYQNMK